MWEGVRDRVEGHGGRGGVRSLRLRGMARMVVGE